MDHVDLSSVFPGWQIVQLIGKGSFGETFKIEKTTAGQVETNALKIIALPKDFSEIEALRNQYDDESIAQYYDDALQKVLKEYNFMRMFRDVPNIVHSNDIATLRQENGLGWYVLIRMELLKPLPQMDPIPINGKWAKITLTKQVCRVGMDICNALKFCENRKVLHRDIKPENIFVSQDTGVYKLGDFGVAKIAEQTMSGTVTGTYKYMAPEVFDRTKTYNHQADLYSLGLTLHWLLNERTIPFMPIQRDRKAVPSPEEEDQAVSRRLQPKKGDVLPAPINGSKTLKKIILKACAYDPVDRYQSAEEMRRDLEAEFKKFNGTITDDGQYDNEFDDDDKNKKRRKKVKSDGHKSKWWLAVVGVLLILIAMEGYAYVGTRIGLAVPSWIPLIPGLDPGKTPAPVMRTTDPPEPTEEPAATPEPTPEPTPESTPEPTPEPTEEPEQTPEPTPEPIVLEWSEEWVDHLPEGVSGENSAIDMRLMYRSAPIISVTDKGSPGSTYVLLPERTTRTQFVFSYTSATKVNEDDLTQVTTKTEQKAHWTNYVYYAQDVAGHEPPAGYVDKGWATIVKNDPKVTGNSTYTYMVKWIDYWYNVYSYDVYKRHRTDYYYNTAEWSEFTEEPIVSTPELMVVTKMQYRYAESENGAFEQPSMENFPVFDADYTGRFQDVTADKWYAPENSDILRTVCELGVLLPDERLNFKPENKVTLGQAIRAAVMIQRLYNGRYPLLGENNGDYQIYADYAVDQGMVDAEFLADLSREASRKELARLLSAALPQEELEALDDSIESVSDLAEDDPCYDAVLVLARAKVVSLQEDGSFNPADSATRAQLASIVDKLIYPEHRG